MCSAMMRRVVLTISGLAVTSLTDARLHAQAPTEVDSLVMHFVEAGASSWWQPFRLYEGCPERQAWQQRGIDQLTSLNLTSERTNDLARAWTHPLRECNDEQLEAWYIREQDEAIQRGEWARMSALRRAIYEADSPRIREYLRTQMMNEQLDEQIRATAGVFYFERFKGEELLREFMSAFATRRMPGRVGWSLAERMLRDQPDRLLLEMGRVVGADPTLTDQTAFRHVVESSKGRASNSARRALGEALEAAAMAGGPVTDEGRALLLSAASALRK